MMQKNDKPITLGMLANELVVASVLPYTTVKFSCAGNRQHFQLPYKMPAYITHCVMSRCIAITDVEHSRL